MRSPSGQNDELALVGDIGGTNARFGLAERGPEGFRLFSTKTLAAAEFDSLETAIAAFLADQHQVKTPERAAIAVAGPVTEGNAQFTNRGWNISEEALLQIGFRSARLLNDFEALAISLPALGDRDMRTIGPSRIDPSGEPIAVIGPGTGFGVSATIHGDGGPLTLSTEGGHIGFAPADAIERDILGVLAKRFGRVSIERILSGPGIVSLYDAMRYLNGATDPLFDDPASIVAAAFKDQPLAVATMQRFALILGSVAGDIALALGARGGVVIAGGIAPKILPFLESGHFRRRFEDKGRMRDYLAKIPTQVILRDDAALLGAAREAFASRRP